MSATRRLVIEWEIARLGGPLGRAPRQLLARTLGHRLSVP
jgi:hypothetical protein